MEEITVLRKPARRGRPNIIGVDRGIGPLEAAILRTLVEIGRLATVREVCDGLNGGGYVAYQGVASAAARLVEKGLLVRTARGRTCLFMPAVGLEELTAQIFTDVVEHIGADPDRAICWLLHIDPDRGAPEIAKLRKRLRARRPPRPR